MGTAGHDALDPNPGLQGASNTPVVAPGCSGIRQGGLRQGAMPGDLLCVPGHASEVDRAICPCSKWSQT